MSARKHLYGLRPEDLVDTLVDQGVPATLTDARRVLGRLISEGGEDPVPRRRPVPRVVQDALRERFRWDRVELVERAVDDADGFVKYLFKADDGALFEAVRIPLDKPGRFTVCLSSQVGCAMACAFCATGRLGLSRNLEPWEIVSSFLTVRDDVESQGARLSGAVFMGQGEPLHNYDKVIQTARVLANPCGGRIARENISISTVGLVEKIRRFTDEGHRFRLVISLTSAVEDKRKKLLPVAGKIPLEDLCDAIRDHAQKSKGRVTVAWVLMGGVNDGEDEVAALKERLGDVPLRVNLIDVNDARDDGFRRATDAERGAFLDLLSDLNVPLVRRYSGGRNAHAACGMLAAKRLNEDRASA